MTSNLLTLAFTPQTAPAPSPGAEDRRARREGAVDHDARHAGLEGVQGQRDGPQQNEDAERLQDGLLNQFHTSSRICSLEDGFITF